MYGLSLMANVLNPKTVLFFAAVLLQFLSSHTPVVPQVLLFGIFDLVLGIIWWIIFVHSITLITSLMGSVKSRVAIDRISGVALILLGGVLALSKRA